MDEWLMQKIQEITVEEQAYLDGRTQVEKDVYRYPRGRTSADETRQFEVDSQLFLRKGKLITVRHHSRFVDFPVHQHNYIEIMYVCMGEITHYIDGKELVMHQGDMLLMNQHVRHSIKRAGAGDVGVNFIVLPEFFDIPFQMMRKQNVIADFLVGILRQNNPIPQYLNFQLRGQKAISNLMENMIASLVNENTSQKEIHDPAGTSVPGRRDAGSGGMYDQVKISVPERRDAGSGGMCDQAQTSVPGRLEVSSEDVINQYSMGLVFLYLIDHIDTLSENSSHNYEDIVIQSTMKYIDAHYRTASLGYIADDFKLSLPTVSRMIKKETGFTFQELLMRKRFQKAVMFLVETELPVEEIAVNIGYENHSYFYRQFKARYGMTPSQYRRMHKNDEAIKL